MEKIIEIKNLSKTYISRYGSVEALRNIDLSISKGEIFGIIGLSGAGKSTLVRCINLLEKPSEGTIHLKGADISAYQKKDLRMMRRSIGMVFQHFNLLMQRSVIKNVMLPLEVAGVSKADAQIRARELLKIVGLSDKENAYPAQLSGGQKQRIGIARALANKPDIILCDEATSALDPDTTNSILKLLKEINKSLGLTVIIITHEMRIIEEICQRVAILDDGKIAEIGDVKEIFARPKTASARKLIYSGFEPFIPSKKSYRIVFDGQESISEPLVADLILKFKIMINILFADAKNIDGKIFGQIIIQLPDDHETINKVNDYLKNHNLELTEVEADGIF
ncbi:MAG: ATP-binding cassette domain-containing protein [Erysipelotrichales bacterium]|nr:ATP-binding cassette domain-containing protein [Erysipelotrichales bacterium]